MNVVGYCRVSTKKDDQLNSLEAQKGFFEKFAKQKGYNLVEIYADEGIGGTTIKKRKELQRLLTDSKSNSFEMVLIKDISRLARNTMELLKIINDFKENNKKVYFLSYSMDAQELSAFNITLLGAVAQEESHNISVRVKASKKRNAEQGKVPNFVYGYDKIPKELFKLKINEEESKIVKEIFDMYVDKKYGATKIAIELNSRGLKTKRGKRWSQNAISRILKNEIYIGKVINNKQKVEDYLKGDRVDNPEEEWNIKHYEELRLIDDDVFNKAQEILAERYDEFGVNRKVRKKESNKYLFSTLIKCKHCGYSYRRLHRKFPKKEYTYWTCSGRNTYGVESCPNATKVDEEEMTSALGHILQQVVSIKDNYIKEIKAEFKRLYDEINPTKLDMDDLIEELKKLKKSEEKEMDLFRNELIDMKTLKEKVKPIKSEIISIEEKISLLKQKITYEDKADDILNKTFSDISSILNISKADNADLKRVIEKIEVDKDGYVEVYFKVLGNFGVKEKMVLNSDISTYSCKKDEREIFYQIIITVYSGM